MSRKICNTAIILAGGKSLRFGRDKAFISFEGRSLIEHILLQLRQDFDELIIVANEIDKFSSLGVPVVLDFFKGAGPLAGIQAGLAASSSPYVFVMACDMPFVSPPLIKHMENGLYETHSEAAVLSRKGFIEPFHAFYSTKLEIRMREALAIGKRGVHSFLRGVDYLNIENEIIRDLCPDERIFININCQSDLDDLYHLK